MELRTFSHPAEVRAKDRKLSGYAAVFGVEARISTDLTERIASGAFTGTLRSGRDILALADHDPKQVLARTKSGTLRLSEDSHGLAFELDVPNTRIGRDLLELSERGDLGGMSFGFTVAKGGERMVEGVREVRDVILHEISVVSSFPAYAQTSVSARANFELAERRMRLWGYR